MLDAEFCGGKFPLLTKPLRLPLPMQFSKTNVLGHEKIFSPQSICRNQKEETEQH
jgi:hypothetical protein